MEKVIGLFSNQKEAEKVVELLAEADLKDADIHTVEKWGSDLEPEPKVMPAIHPGAGSSGTAVPITTRLPDLDFNDEIKQFLKRNLEEGGVLVAVNPSDDFTIAEVRNIVKEQGGRVINE